jgi:pilus assembly protein CpaC
MKVRFVLAFLLFILAARSVSQAQQLAAAGSLEAAGPSSLGGLSLESAPSQAALNLPQQAPSDIHVALGKSVLITSQEGLARVSVTDPTIASAVVVAPTQILIHGLKGGAGTLILWDNHERARSFNVLVDLDVNGLRDAIRDTFPKESLVVTQSGGSIVLTGNVSSKEIMDRAALLAGTVSPAVVNLLQTTSGREVVMLQVRFAEVDRSAIQELGLNLFSTGAANTIGAMGTGQFGQTLANVGAVPSNVGRGTDPKSPSLASGGIGRTLQDTPSVFGLSDLLNIFLFRPDLNLGLTIKALQQRNLLQMLAEPNLMALNGSEASFLAGGEFPFPILQGGVTNAVTIMFKEFGVRLNFKPTVMPDGVIRLKMTPEVSALDFAHALTVSGFVIPALSTRRTTTEVELEDGQSFAVAGLIDNRLTEIASKVPMLGDVPILGQLFRSRAQNKTNTELLVMVTPKVVQAVGGAQVPALPEFPKPFLDPKSFDGKSGETPSHGSNRP